MKFLEILAPKIFKTPSHHVFTHFINILLQNSLAALFLKCLEWFLSWYLQFFLKTRNYHFFELFTFLHYSFVRFEKFNPLTDFSYVPAGVSYLVEQLPYCDLLRLSPLTGWFVLSVRQVVRLRVVKKSRVLSLRAIELCFFICQIFYLSKGLTSVFTQPSEICVTESESKNFV